MVYGYGGGDDRCGDNDRYYCSNGGYDIQEDNCTIYVVVAGQLQYRPYIKVCNRRLQFVLRC